MLIGISPLLSPDLLATLARMGHGDEIVLADAHFPGHSLGAPTLRADGLGIAPLLDAILPLFPLDEYVEAPLAMMAAVEGDTLDPSVEANYRQSFQRHGHADARIDRVERFEFYQRARHAFAIVVTGETAKYGNLLLKKGLVPTT